MYPIDAEPKKSEGQNILLQNLGFLYRLTARSFPSFISISNWRAGTAAFKEWEINCVHTAELRLLSACQDCRSAFICIHFHCLCCRTDDRNPENAKFVHLCSYHILQKTLLWFIQGWTEWNFMLLVTLGSTELLGNPGGDTLKIYKTHIKIRATLLLANGPILLHSMQSPQWKCIWGLLW